MPNALPSNTKITCDPRSLFRGYSPRRSQLALAAVVSLFIAGQTLAAEPRVDLEVALEDGSVPTEARAWSDMLTQAGFSSVRIRSGKNDTPALQMVGTVLSPAYKVTGILTTTNQLVLPRGRFGLSDRAQIAQWLKKVRDAGEEGLNVKTVAFGLLPKQLVAVHEALGVRLEASTLGRPTKEVAKQIADKLTYKFIADGTAQRALAVDDPVADELNGLSSGTALAAVLRPLGLVMFPERNGPDLRLRIAAAKDTKESWPVGWPPQGNPSQTVPELFKYLKVEINNTPVSEVMLAIAGRVKMPLLVDHTSVARERVDLQAPVSFPTANTYYDRALDRMLMSAKLKYEIRVDEAEKPFLWITTLRQ